MDFALFARALFGDWVGLMSGLASIVLTLFGFFRPTSNQRRAFWVAAAVCFLMACIHIWTIEHRARLAAEDERKPDISVAITTDMTATLDGKETVLTLVFTAVNKGASSYLDLKTLSVKLPDGTSVKARLMMNRSVDTVIPGTPELVLLRSNYIGDKFLEHPLVRGTMTSAWGMFVLPGVARSSFTRGTIIEASFEDIEKKKISTTFVVGSQGSEDVWMP